MHLQHHPTTSHAITDALLTILERSQTLLQRRIETSTMLTDLRGIEVSDSTFGEWEAAGGVAPPDLTQPGLGGIPHC